MPRFIVFAGAPTVAELYAQWDYAPSSTDWETIVPATQVSPDLSAHDVEATESMYDADSSRPPNEDSDRSFRLTQTSKISIPPSSQPPLPPQSFPPLSFAEGTSQAYKGQLDFDDKFYEESLALSGMRVPQRPGEKDVEESVSVVSLDESGISQFDRSRSMGGKGTRNRSSGESTPVLDSSRLMKCHRLKRLVS